MPRLAQPSLEKISQLHGLLEDLAAAHNTSSHRSCESCGRGVESHFSDFKLRQKFLQMRVQLDAAVRAYQRGN